MKPQPATSRPWAVFQPLTRADLPFGLLCAAALAAPMAVLGQGGDWHTAMLAACVVLGVPALAIEAMVALARAAAWARGGEE